MKKVFLYMLLSLLLSGNANANEFSNWLKSLEFSKTIFQDKEFYMGITYTGKPGKLQDISEILFSFIYEDTYSGDGRYLIRAGCKPKGCGNKGMMWIDLEKKVAIGVIRHSFWEKLDFSKMKKNQIFIFSNFYEDTNRFPKEFIKSYSKWISENEIKPSKYRFLNSNNELLDIENIR